MRARKLVLIAAGVLAVSFLVADLAFADDVIWFRARLESCCGDPEPEAEGKADRRTQFKRGVAWKDKFSAKVEIPVPSPGLGILTPLDAQLADVRLVLSRAGVVYAECMLVLDDDEGAEGEAEYHVDLEFRTRTGRAGLRARHGSCDVDLVTPGVQNGVPDVQDGDVATVNVMGLVAVPFADGMFRQK
ncbi:MAG TPA: hypothetical protein VJB36_00980 [Methylomirabilota bacterium]|nr:hypothetical protein [Methylomirabilota bacterium]